MMVEKTMKAQSDQDQSSKDQSSKDQNGKDQNGKDQNGKAPEQTAREWLEEYVTVELFKDSGRYKEDVYLQINNENCLIQRGQPVQVKRKFALLLDQVKRQERAADAVRAEAARGGAWS